MATTSHTDEETGSSSSQFPTTTARNHVLHNCPTVRNEEFGRRTGWQKLQVIIKKRLRWLGHVLRMDSRIPREPIQWELKGYKRKPGRSRKNWMDIIR